MVARRFENLFDPDLLIFSLFLNLMRLEACVIRDTLGDYGMISVGQFSQYRVLITLLAKFWLNSGSFICLTVKDVLLLLLVRDYL